MLSRAGDGLYGWRAVWGIVRTKVRRAFALHYQRSTEADFIEACTWMEGLGKMKLGRQARCRVSCSHHRTLKPILLVIARSIETLMRLPNLYRHMMLRQYRLLLRVEQLTPPRGVWLCFTVWVSTVGSRSIQPPWRFPIDSYSKQVVQHWALC